jgi:hypothetical protein
MSEETAMRKSVVAAAVIGLGLCVCVLGAEETAGPATQPLVVGQSVVSEKGTLVTVHGEGVPVREILSDVEKQSGVKVRSLRGRNGGNAEGALVTLSAEDRPVMEVVKDLMDQVNKESSGNWSLMEGNSGVAVTGPLSAKGAFLMEAEDLVHVADYRRAEGQEDRLTLKVRVMVDPALRPVLYATQCAAGVGGKAEDEGGHSLAPTFKVDQEPKAAEERGPSDPLWLGETEIMLERPAEAGRRIEKLEGTIPVWIAEKTERFELEKGETKEGEVAGVKVKVTLGEDKSLGGWDVSCSFTRPAGMSDAEWDQRSEILATTRLWAEGTDGRRLESNGGGASWGNASRSKTARFRPTAGQAGEAPHGVVEVVAGVKRVEAGYSFEGLPLP